ncbi:hypothetical protein [Hugenholtzia roseola]|uniref:hypothetical protein n=1 Tax=Hugenholtzia roseola TaxID=1002 RepID=UPI00041BAD0E|nr:hypothetical protein [Hugenholtzia roseola]
MKIYENPFIHLFYYAETGLIHFYYYNDGASMEEEDFKTNMRVYADAVEQYLPDKLLVDTSILAYTIPVEVQEWVAKEIAPRTTCLKRMAFVVADDVFSQVSVEQMMEEDEIAQNYDAPRYFNDPEEAKKWLFS